MVPVSLLRMPAPFKTNAECNFCFLPLLYYYIENLFGFLSVSENESYSGSLVKAKCCKVNFPKARLLV